MAGKASDAAPEFRPEQYLNLSKERAQEMLNLQKELLHAYEEASRAWLARVKLEVDLWSDLARKLTETHSAPEMLQAYQKCVAQRLQMASEDGQRMAEESQKIAAKVIQSMSVGAPRASS